MNEEHGNNESGNVVPVGVLGKKDLNKRKWKYLTLYLVYIGIVLAAGIALAAHQKRPAFPDVDIVLTQNSSFGLPVAQVPVEPLPDGILIFDAETKQTTVPKGEAQASFVFNLRNASKKPLIINEVKTSCGCTVAKVQQLPWVLKPQDKGQIAVTMKVLGVIQKSTKVVTVYTDQGSKSLTVEAIRVPAEKPQ